MAQRRPTRRWLLAGLAGAALAACAGFWALLPPNALEAARGRVPLGSDLETVEAAVGRLADGTIARTAVPDDARRVAFWEYSDDQMLVEFDADGRSVKADVYRWWSPTVWERFRA